MTTLIVIVAFTSFWIGVWSIVTALKNVADQLVKARLLFTAVLQRDGKLDETQYAFQQLEASGYFDPKNWTPDGFLGRYGTKFDSENS
jgi:hypothetical protein